MFSKALSSSVLLLAFLAQVNAHAAVAPALGVDGTPVRSDVQRPSTAKPCGTIDVASTLDTSTPVAAAADGQFTATATDFNAGADGSLQFSATVDPTGEGTSFPGTVTISKNGDSDPAAVSSQQLVASLPAGTKCTGGTDGNLCLVSFKSTAGFGNCVVVQQGAAAATTAAGAAGNTTAVAAAGAAGNATAAGDATTAATSGNTTASTSTGTAATTKHGHKHHGKKAGAAKTGQAQATANQKIAARNIGGTRLARALSGGNMQVWS